MIVDWYDRFAASGFRIPHTTDYEKLCFTIRIHQNEKPDPDPYKMTNIPSSHHNYRYNSGLNPLSDGFTEKFCTYKIYKQRPYNVLHWNTVQIRYR